MGIVLELEESEFAGWIDDGARYAATVVGIRLREKPFKDDAGQPIKKIEFAFKLISDDGQDGRDIWGETSTRFNSHPECVIEGTSVLPVGHLLGATKSFYEGSVVRLVTRAGEGLTVTMNHPVLTGRGWVPASEVSEGDQVVRQSYTESTWAGEDFDHVPARVEEVFDALKATAPSGWCAAAATDFHGDGEFVKGEVDVVGAHGLLHYRIQPGSDQQGKRNVLVGGPGGVRLLDSEGTQPFALGGDVATATSGASRLGGARVVAAVAHDDPAFTKTVQDRDFVAADFVADLRDGGAGGVALDEVVDVQVQPWAGHVYNLHTTSNAFFANGIATHNCRLKNWAEAILGLKLPPHYRLDTDTLLDRHCFVVVGRRDYTNKDGEAKVRNFVRDVQPTTANAKALADATSEPF
jgi:hypothetical protein